MARIPKPGFAKGNGGATPVLFYADTAGGMTQPEAAAIDAAHERHGGDAARTFAETGGYRVELSGKPVHIGEIDDRGMRLKADLGKLKASAGKDTTLGAVIEHPELFARFPHLADVPVRVRDKPELAMMANVAASSVMMLASADQIDLIARHIDPADASGFLDNLTHEVQHVLDYESFSDYGPPGRAVETTDEILQGIYGERLAAQRAAGIAAFERMETDAAAAGAPRGFQSSIGQAMRWQRYATSPMEAHAMLSEERRTLSADERRARPPQTEIGDTARKDVERFRKATDAWMQASGFDKAQATFGGRSRPEPENAVPAREPQGEPATATRRGFQNPKNLRSALAAQGKKSDGVKD